ncbi:thiol:disulfide interchange protein, partial [Acidithiobacillus ferridurans]|nr:thiol:disulfide interchange protein [Acidithiobacillus ferridurans]
TEEGGTRPLAQIPAEDMKAVHANTALLQSSGEEATPTLLFCRKKGMVLVHGIAVSGLPALIHSLRGDVSAEGCTP